MASGSLKYIPLSYDHADSQASALRLVLSIRPEWEGPENNIEFVRFTDGITNTVCGCHSIKYFPPKPDKE
jgi:ethanolamine kinase